MKNVIAFPGLGIGPLTVSTSFKYYGMTVHWYGVIIASGIELAYLYARKKAKKRDILDDQVTDVLLWGLPSAIICARLYYVIFSWSEYSDNFLDVFKIWEGGIAIYGAVIGACLSTVIYCRVKKISIGKMFDVGAYGLLIGQIIGRWGNFVNAEAYGTETETALLRMALVNKNLMVHPTFLYESLWNLLVFIVINLCEKYQKFNGEIFLWYVTGYGLGRFFVEGMRTDSLMLGSFRVSQVLAALCVICGTALIVFFRKKQKKEIQETL